MTNLLLLPLYPVMTLTGIALSMTTGVLILKTLSETAE
jgi:hypothetical protein